jgi:hypothetical protein
MDDPFFGQGIFNTHFIEKFLPEDKKERED